MVDRKPPTVKEQMRARSQARCGGTRSAEIITVTLVFTLATVLFFYIQSHR